MILLVFSLFLSFVNAQYPDCPYGTYLNNFNRTCDECGISNVDPNLPRIFAGSTAEKGSWPGHIMIVRYDEVGDPVSYRCGGVLVSLDWVLTAAHCIEDPIGDTFRIYTGLHRLEDVNTGFISFYTPLLVIPYPGFSSPKYQIDIGLIKLTKPVTLSSNVQVACLPHKDNLESPEQGRYLYLAGFGSIAYDIAKPIYPTFLQNTRMEVLTQRACIDKTNEESNFCASDAVSGGCIGDSGGPFYTKSNILVDSKGKNKYFISGILSRGVSKSGSPPNFCNNSYDIAVRTWYHYDWIKNTILFEFEGRKMN